MANYDIAIFKGHGKSEKDGKFDCGAVGNNKTEYEVVNQLVEKIALLLTNSSYKVHVDENNYKDNDTLGNSYRLKYALSIHLNAGGGTGSECIVPLGESYFKIENNILAELSKLGFVNRGVKSRDYNSEKWSQRTHGVKMSGTNYYGEIRQAWDNGISLTILEVGFIDNLNDLNKILSNLDKIAYIIASSIAQEDGKVIKPLEVVEPPKPSTNEFYRVVCGSFSNKANAEARVKELKKHNFECFIEKYNK